MNSKKTIMLLLGGLITTQTASAYIDPGTAGMVAGGLGSSLWALILTVGGIISAFIIKYFWLPIKMGFARLKGLIWKEKKK